MKKYQNGLMEELLKKYSSLVSLLTSSLNSKSLTIILLGIVLTTFGAIYLKSGQMFSSSKIEIIKPSTLPQETNEIVVEIVGSVEKPGVYKMKNGDRVEDLLIISGGLASSADRNWVDKNINRAAKIIDGQKIYIYSTEEVKYQLETSSARKTGGVEGVKTTLNETVIGGVSLVNINTSSLSELDKLPGIGPVYGQSIIEHRPYSDLGQLVKSGAINNKVFEKIKDLITL